MSNNDCKCKCGRNPCIWTCLIFFIALSFCLVMASGFTQGDHCTDDSKQYRLAFTVGAAFAFLFVGPFFNCLCGSGKCCNAFIAALFAILFLVASVTCAVLAGMSISKHCGEKTLVLGLLSGGWLSAFIGGCLIALIINNAVGYVSF